MSNPDGNFLSGSAAGAVSAEGVGQAQEIHDKIVQAWREQAQELLDMEKENIANRIPVSTGTLLDSLTGVTNPDPITIIDVYTDPDIQLSGPWGRVYDTYQEGPPLGASTYTNEPRQFIYSALTEDEDQIRSWVQAIAQKVAQEVEKEIHDEQAVMYGDSSGEGEGGGGVRLPQAANS